MRRFRRRCWRGKRAWIYAWHLHATLPAFSTHCGRLTRFAGWSRRVTKWGCCPPHLYSPGHAFHGMGSEDGLERLDQVRHLATPALVKTSPAEAVLAHQDGLDPPFPAVQGYALPKESKRVLVDLAAPVNATERLGQIFSASPGNASLKTGLPETRLPGRTALETAGPSRKTKERKTDARKAEEGGGERYTEASRASA